MRKTRGEGDGLRPLSATEHAVLLGIARGDDFDAIAATVGVTKKTVAYHATKLRRLLRAPNLPALVAIALVAGVLTGDMLGFDGIIGLTD